MLLEILFGTVINCVYPLSCWTRIYPPFANSVDPDQLASEDVNWSGSALFAIQYVNLYHCLDQVIWLAENIWKWVWHLHLFSMRRVISPAIFENINIKIHSNTIVLTFQHYDEKQDEGSIINRKSEQEKTLQVGNMIYTALKGCWHCSIHLHWIRRIAPV